MKFPAMYTFKTTDSDMHLNSLNLLERQWGNMIRYGDRIDTKEKNKKAAHKNRLK